MGPNQEPKPLGKGDKVYEIIMNFAKNMKEKIQGLVDKEAKNCMEFDEAERALFKFVFRTNPEASY